MKWNRYQEGITARNFESRRYVYTRLVAPNRVWVSDIIYIPTDKGLLYLAGLKDLFNGELVGYATFTTRLNYI